MKNAVRTGCALACVALLLGCGGGEPAGRVSGVITLDGAPLGRARVTFSHASGRFVYGETDANGRYELQATDGSKNVPVGQHDVSVTTAFTGRNEAGEMVDFPERVPPRYNDETDLREEVVDGSQQIDLALESGVSEG